MMDPKAFVPHLIRWEGNFGWLYRDNAPAGNCTVGIGCLVPSRDAAAALPFLDDAGMFAHKEAVKADFDRVMSLPPAHPARFYRGMPALELAEDSIADLAVKRIAAEFLPGLRRLLPGFDGFPDAAQIALTDMIFNLGEGASATTENKATGLHGFPSMLNSCRAGDWMGAASECHRKTCRVERNDWTRSQFLLAAT